MVIVVKTIYIYEVGLSTAKLGCSFIHKSDEGICGAGNVFCGAYANLIGGAHQYGVKTILHRNLLAGIKSYVGAVSVYAPYGIFGHSKCVTHIALFKDYKRSHQLSCTGRVLLGVGIFFVDNLSGFCIHNYGGLTGYNRKAVFILCFYRLFSGTILSILL